MRDWLPGAAGALAVLLVMDVVIPQDQPGWVAWLGMLAGAALGDLIRRLW